jgi:hypothetical protein
MTHTIPVGAGWAAAPSLLDGPVNLELTRKRHDLDLKIPDHMGKLLR